MPMIEVIRGFTLYRNRFPPYSERSTSEGLVKISPNDSIVEAVGYRSLHHQGSQIPGDTASSGFSGRSSILPSSPSEPKNDPQRFPEFQMTKKAFFIMNR